MANIIPKTANDVTEAWVRENTGFEPVEGTIEIEGNVQAGIGFLSNLCRVSFQTENGSRKNILVKLLPDAPDFRALSMDQKFDQAEIKFYSEVLPNIIEVSPELEVNFCKYYGGKYVDSDKPEEYESMIIMQDLKPLGYEILTTACEQWESNLEKVLIFLAKFHAAGFAMEEKKNMKLSQLFPFIQGVDDSKLNLFFDLAQSGADRVPEVLKRFNCPKGIQDAYESILGDTKEIVIKVLKQGSGFPSLIHGDLWPPNVMLAGPDDPVKIIDWQILAYRDATYELTPVIFTMLHESAMLDVARVDKFARFYYREFCKEAKSKGLTHALSRSEEEFMNFFNSWGICYGYVWFLFSVDAFPNNPKRLYDGFFLLQEKYRVVDLLK